MEELRDFTTFKLVVTLKSSKLRGRRSTLQFMHKKIAAAIALSSLYANADVLTATQRFFGMGGQYPEYTEEDGQTGASFLDQAPYSPADSDLGVQEILVERAERAPLIFDFSTAILRTDNAPGDNPLGPGEGDQSSWISASSFALAWRPHVAKGWFADVGMGQDFLRYDRKNATDFENFNMRLGTFKILPDLDDTVVFARLEYQRITSTSFRDGDYSARRIRAGLQKALWVANRQQVTGSVSGAYEWSARPVSLERNELSAELAYSYSFTDSLYSRVSARASSFDYDQFGRDDQTYGLALELIWQINENFRANASIFFDKTDSDTNTFGFTDPNEFASWTSGLGISAQWAF